VVRTRYASSAPMANSAAKYWMIVMTTIRVRCEVARAGQWGWRAGVCVWNPTKTSERE
jgi:hypothetical protein